MIPPSTSERQHRRELTVRLSNNAGTDHEISFGMLAQVLSEMQQAFYLIAMQQEGREIHERARIAGDIERTYVLHASIPVSGSYAIPALVGDPGSDLFAPDRIADVLDTFQRFSAAIGSAASDTLLRIVPDSQLRRRILERFRSMIPKAGSGWDLEIQYERGESVTLDEHARTTITQVLKRVDGEAGTYTVTGRLVKIDFEEHRLTLHYPVNQREIECSYDAAIEELLLQNPRELIQVTGIVTLDDDDNPKRITDVEDIREVDLAPFRLSKLSYHDYALRFRTPLELVPTLDESQQVMCLEYPALGIDVYATTREELEEALQEDIDVLWRNYATADPEILTEDARILRQNLLNAIEEVNNAA